VLSGEDLQEWLLRECEILLTVEHPIEYVFCHIDLWFDDDGAVIFFYPAGRGHPEAWSKYELPYCHPEASPEGISNLVLKLLENTRPIQTEWSQAVCR
jgi:hypothetical protein